jgi:carbamoyl-phosphate synthase large subunit
MAMNIVLSCIGKRGYIADYFREALPPGSKVVGTSDTEWTPGLSSCDISLVMPPISSDEYIPALLEECRKHEISGLLSLYDPDVHKLSAYRQQFSKAGVVPIVPDLPASMVAFDKLETYRFLSDLEIAAPLTTDSMAEAEQWLGAEQLSFPLVVKPRFGFGSANTFIARNAEELGVFYRYAPGMIIQRFMDAEALNVDGLGDLSAKPVCVVPWRKLLSRMGETERSVTIECPALVALAEELIEKVGIIGPFDGDFFRDASGKLWVLELNLRFGGGYPVSHLAGADFPGQIVRLMQGETLERTDGGYKRGVTMMKKLQIIPGPVISGE